MLIDVLDGIGSQGEITVAGISGLTYSIFVSVIVLVQPKQAMLIKININIEASLQDIKTSLYLLM